MEIMACRYLAVAAAWLVFHAGGAGAVGTLIPAAGRVDMVHDAQRGFIYITDGDKVLRYHEASGTFIDPVTLGGRLGGLDLSPDGTVLAIADRASSAGEVWVHLLRLDDLQASKLTAPKAFYEDGTWTAAFAADGTLLVTSRFAGSGWVPMRRWDLGQGTWKEVASVRQDTMVTASGDGRTIAFAEANISDGSWGAYDTASGQLVRRQGYDAGTSWFNFEIGADAAGKQFAIPTYGGTFIYNEAYAQVARLGQYAGPQPIGVAYHPVENLVYFPWAGTGEVRAFDTATFAQVGSWDFEDSFQATGNAAFRQGRTRLSRDGSLLMVSVTGGVRILRLYEPLSAAPVSAGTAAGTPVILALQGAIGNGGRLAYSILRAPAHGTVSVNGSAATYTPAAGFSGEDSFIYRVSYGRATADAEATISVVKANLVPVAENDFARTARNTAVAIPVLANDHDPDGDPLSIAAFDQPAYGAVALDGGRLVYTPPRNYQGTAAFAYMIADGQGGTASATVTVTVTKR